MATQMQSSESVVLVEREPVTEPTSPPRAAATVATPPAHPASGRAVVVAAIVVASLVAAWSWHVEHPTWAKAALCAAPFAVFMTFCHWRASKPYLVWGVLALGAGLLWATGWSGGAVAAAGVAALLFVALSFSRVSLRIATIVVVVLLVALAMRFPPPELTGPGGVEAPVQAVNAWVVHGWNSISFSDHAPAPNLSVAAWVLIGLALLMGYRYLEVLAARGDPGPVKIVAAEDVDATKEPTTGAPLDLTTRFRLWLDETELRNSAAVPGGAETQRILKILQTESASGDIVDKILKVLRMVAAVAFPETGFTVVLASRCFAGHGAARKQWKVTGRLTDTRTGRVLGQLVSTADSEDEAGRNVAYQVALRIGHATNSFPRWACWTDADAWMAYDDAAQLPPGRKQVEAYESVVTRSPGCGLARAALANAILSREPQAGVAYPHALSVLLPVALHFPRFTPARYRIVVMLAYFSTPDGWNKWVDGGKRCRREKACLTSWKDTRQRVAHQLFPDTKDYSHRRAIECGAKRDTSGRIAFRTAAERHLADLTKYTRLPRALRWALVPSERCYWIDILRTPRRLRQQRSAYLIGRRVLALIPGEPGQAINQGRLAAHARKVDAIASKPHCGRQALYNAACFHARCFELLGSGGGTLVEQELEASAAYRLLYESIYESEGAAWAATWFDSDPDLEPLRGLRRKDRRWDHLLQELGTDTDQPGTTRT